MYVPSTREAQRSTDKRIWTNIKAVVSKETDLVLGIRKVEDVLQHRISTNRVLWENRRDDRLLSREKSTNGTRGTSFCGAPAVYLTKKEILAQRRKGAGGKGKNKRKKASRQSLVNGAEGNAESAVPCVGG